MSQLKLVVYIMFAFLVAVFSVYNQETVSLRFFGAETSISLVIVVLGAILLGVVLTAVLGFLSQSKLKKKISILEKNSRDMKGKEEKLQLKIRELEEEIEEKEHAGMEAEKESEEGEKKE